jgi:dienelactone hydrolase
MGFQIIAAHKLMNNARSIVLFLALAVAVVLLILVFGIQWSESWRVEDIRFKARDGFELRAFLLRPDRADGKHPGVACFHQLWGNRDDFLKLLPKMAEAGVVTLVPNFLRQQPTYDPRRISDLRDAIEFLEGLEYVDPQRLGIITASFSVETGLMAILDKPNVIADVMISGQILREDSRKWLTFNSDLAIFTIASVDDGSHFLLMDEYLGRSLNPHSRKYFISKESDPYSIQAHGTFVFDEVPETLDMVRRFFVDVFGLEPEDGGRLRGGDHRDVVTVSSTDGFPVVATFKPATAGTPPHPAVILYPPQFQSRLYYTRIAERLARQGVTVLAPNTKRTCRVEEKLHLCDKEIHGAIEFLKTREDVDPDRLAVVFPSFYYLVGKKMVTNGELPAKIVVFMDAGSMDYDVEPSSLDAGKYKLIHLRKSNLGKLSHLLIKEL